MVVFRRALALAMLPMIFIGGHELSRWGPHNSKTQAPRGEVEFVVAVPAKPAAPQGPAALPDPEFHEQWARYHRLIARKGKETSTLTADEREFMTKEFAQICAELDKLTK